jgi:hypothetical protein
MTFKGMCCSYLMCLLSSSATIVPANLNSTDHIPGYCNPVIRHKKENYTTSALIFKLKVTASISPPAHYPTESTTQIAQLCPFHFQPIYQVIWQKNKSRSSHLFSEEQNARSTGLLSSGIRRQQYPVCLLTTVGNTFSTRS